MRPQVLVQDTGRAPGEVPAVSRPAQEANPGFKIVYRRNPDRRWWQFWKPRWVEFYRFRWVK